MTLNNAKLVILFIVGILIVIDATLIEESVNILELVLGLVVLGIIPLEVFTSIYIRNGGSNGHH